MAKIQSTNCPNCNSIQKFAPKERVEKDVIVKFISCNMCREEIVIDTYLQTNKKSVRRASIIRNRKSRREVTFDNG